MTEEEKEKQRQYNKTWYKNNKSSFIQRVIKEKRQRIQDRKLFVDEIKLRNGCSLCGYNKNPAALDFHHRENKVGAISIVRNNFGLKKLLEEIDKCEILCANCHRELTYPHASIVQRIE